MLGWSPAGFSIGTRDENGDGVVQMLSDRRRQVLNALIEEYISTATPVSSRAIVGKHKIGVSSATVRNELNVLEEDGYVVSPHVSSGRIPTDSGYRMFVDELLENVRKREEASRSLSAKEGQDAGGSKAASDPKGAGGVDHAADPASSIDEEMERELRDSASELDSLLRETSRALNRFTACLAVVMAPKVTNVALRRIALVPLDQRHVILVIAVKDGRVLNRTVELDHAHSPEEISALEALLNRRHDIADGFDPVKIGEAWRRIGLSGSAVQATLERLSDNVEACLLEEERDCVHINGMEDLFSQPEMQSMSLTLGFARLLDDDLLIFRLLGDLLASRGVTVRIGHENPDESFSGVSVVSSSYGDDGSEGIVAIVGPTRMDYWKMINAVRRVSIFLDGAVGDKD